MKIGDKIRIKFHGHPEQWATTGTVTAVLGEGVVTATIDDPLHPLYRAEDYWIAPSNYEAV
jgi:hypothetical protein